MVKKILPLIILFLFLTNLTLSAQKTEKGIASYYASKLHKRRAASGEVYHKDSMVCAHKTFPFGTLLEVWNPKNDRSVVVKVIDRGPHTKGRVVDLSYAAAKELDIINHGLVKVEVKPYKPKRFKPLTELKQTPVFLLKAPVFILEPRKINSK